jgi:uncharacterized protein (TIGR02757 family)
MQDPTFLTEEVKDFLNEKVTQYNQSDFIEFDPISIPHRYDSKEDIEISSFLTATISWGKRKMILKNADKMMNIFGNSPYDFVMSYDNSTKHLLYGFVHRTFNPIDLDFFIKSLKNIYTNHGGMEKVFAANVSDKSVLNSITAFKQVFFSIDHPPRTTKHVGDPAKGSVAKRLNMMLRWLCRQDNNGVDFGIWKSISPSVLSCPLDVHSGNVARELGLINRNQNDLKALHELDNHLRQLDPEDPTKYDFALFGVGESGELK